MTCDLGVERLHEQVSMKASEQNLDLMVQLHTLLGTVCTKKSSGPPSFTFTLYMHEQMHLKWPYQPPKKLQGM
eukprot:1157217-Pelagomonas_calceolata.AAC.10